jgi:hypothetical protein
VLRQVTLGELFRPAAAPSLRGLPLVDFATAPHPVAG